MSKYSAHQILLLFLALFISFFLQIHAVPLFDVDEGAFSQATREMFLRDDFVSTYLNNQPRYDKPILIYWLQAASIASFGVNEFAFRLPSAIASTLWVLVVFVFTRKILNSHIAWLAALFMATSMEIALIGKAATADATLNLFITASMLSLYQFLHTQRPKFLYITALCVGLGFLTKGPIALVIPAIVSFLHCLISGRWRQWLQTVSNPIAWILFAIIALPWYILQYIKHGNEFLQGFFLHHNIERFQHALEGHHGALWYYVPVILLGILPYSGVLLYTLTQYKSLVRNEFSRYLLLWFGFIFVFFSLSATKLPHYVIYGYPPLFILMAMHVESIRGKIWLLLPQLILLTLLLALPTILVNSLLIIQDIFVRAMLENPLQYFSRYYYIIIVTCLFILIYLLWMQKIVVYHQLIISGILSNFIIAWLILPIIATVQQQPIKQAALISQQFNENIVMWKLHTPSFSVYRGKIVERREPVDGELVLTKTHFIKELKSYNIIYQKNGVTLAKVLQVK